MDRVAVGKACYPDIRESILHIRVVVTGDVMHIASMAAVATLSMILGIPWSSGVPVGQAEVDSILI